MVVVLTFFVVIARYAIFVCIAITGKNKNQKTVSAPGKTQWSHCSPGTGNGGSDDVRASPGGDAAHGEIRSVLQTESRRLETFGKQCLSQPRKFYYSDDDDAELIKTSSLWGWLMAITRNKSLSPAESLLSLEARLWPDPSRRWAFHLIWHIVCAVIKRQWSHLPWLNYSGKVQTAQVNYVTIRLMTAPDIHSANKVNCLQRRID